VMTCLKRAVRCGASGTLRIEPALLDMDIPPSPREVLSEAESPLIKWFMSRWVLADSILVSTGFDNVCPDRSSEVIDGGRTRGLGLGLGLWCLENPRSSDNLGECLLVDEVLASECCRDLVDDRSGVAGRLMHGKASAGSRDGVGDASGLTETTDRTGKTRSTALGLRGDLWRLEGVGELLAAIQESMVTELFVGTGRIVSEFWASTLFGFVTSGSSWRPPSDGGIEGVTGAGWAGGEDDWDCAWEDMLIAPGVMVVRAWSMRCCWDLDYW
jgi:hypothetical protein